MKRKGNLYFQIYDLDNLRLADKKASRGKSYQKGVIEHRKVQEENIVKLHFILRNKEYKTSPYKHFQIKEDKVRDISRLPYMPDRICQHGICNIIEPILTSTFTADTYAAIKGRGLHKASFAVRKQLNRDPTLKYALKLDVKKFYPSIDHDILKALLRRKIKCIDTLNLLDEIIDSCDGLALGNYISQPLANFYLTGFDRYLKQELCVKNLARYCDDIVILADNKPYLHDLLIKIKEYLWNNLKLEVKSNYQVFLIESRGIDFCGYVVRRNYVRLRKRIKKNFKKMLHNNRNDKSLASYRGWATHCNGKHLIKKILSE